MGSFFAPPDGYPQVPLDPPAPPPNFEAIGGSIFAGAAKSSGTSSAWDWFFNGLMKFLTAGLGWLLSNILQLMAFLVKQLNAISDTAGGAYGQLVSNTLQNLLGVTIDPASVNPVVLGQNRNTVGTTVGKAIINALYSTMPAATGSGVPPSEAAADQFLSVAMRMVLNGWMESFITDAASVHLLEKYGDLKDDLERTLGMGRLARAAFAPPMKVFVHDPYLAALNQKFRPKPIDVGTAMRAFYRGDVDNTFLSQVLGDQGYSESEILFLISDHRKAAPIADIDYLLSRSIWTNDTAIEELRQQGYNLTTAQLIVNLLNDKRTFKYREQMATIAKERFVAGDIDQTTYESVVSTLNLPTDEQQWLINVATFERSTKVTHLSLGQIEQGILDGVLSFVDLSAWAQRVNMPLDEVAELELMILFKQNKESATAKAKAAAAAAKATAAQAKAAAAATKAAQAKAAAADKGLSASQAETLVIDGLWTFDQLTAFLDANGYGPDAVTAIVALLHNKLAAAAAKAGTAAGVRTSAAAKGLNLAEVEKAVIDGVLQIADLQKWLDSHGYDAADAQVIVELTQESLAAAQVKAAAKVAAAAKAADRQLSLPEVERAVRLGLTSLDAYNAALKAAGFDPAAITLLDGLLNAQIASDKAAAAKKATLATAAGEKAASLPQIEAEVTAGIRPISDYTAALRQLGYSPADQTQLTSLLQLKVDQQKATVAKRQAAAQALAARGISLTQAETAVKLGVVPIATYQQILRTAGYTPDAVDVLTSTLLAQVAKASKAQNAANAAAGTLATKGISLPELEHAVIAGLQPISNYTATLSTAGYSAADTATLTQLLQLKVDQAQHAAAAHADADGAATQKGISLGKEEAAVVAGDLTMDNYDALLTKLGFDDVDRAVLEDLLQKKIDAAAAKAAG